jgi:hypothetical protein
VCHSIPGEGGTAPAMNLPSVTQIISTVGEHWLNFDAVPKDRLEFVCQRGSDFHRLAALTAQSLWVDEIPDSCAGFLMSFTRWLKDFIAKVVLVEQQLVDEHLGFSGTPDAILRIKGDPGLTLVDWKSGQTASKGWRLQISAYRHLAETNGYPIGRVATLQPHPDGKKAKFTEYTRSLTADWNVFRSMLNVWRFFNAG